MSDITLGGAPAPATTAATAAAGNEPLKGPFARETVNESIRREQGDMGPYAPEAGELVTGGIEARNFRLLSLSKFSVLYVCVAWSPPADLSFYSRTGLRYSQFVSIAFQICIARTRMLTCFSAPDGQQWLHPSVSPYLPEDLRP